MQTLALSSRDGRFQVSVASDDFELIASMLLLLEMVPAPTASGVHLEGARRDRGRASAAMRSPAARTLLRRDIMRAWPARSLRTRSLNVTN